MSRMLMCVWAVWRFLHRRDRPERKRGWKGGRGRLLQVTTCQSGARWLSCEGRMLTCGLLWLTLSKLVRKGARLSGAFWVRGLHKPVVVRMGALRLTLPSPSFHSLIRLPLVLKTSCKSLSKASPWRDLLDKAVEVRLNSQKVSRGANTHWHPWLLRSCWRMWLPSGKVVLKAALRFLARSFLFVFGLRLPSHV